MFRKVSENLFFSKIGYFWEIKIGNLKKLVAVLVSASGAKLLVNILMVAL
jgi:hypothetical protein